MSDETTESLNGAGVSEGETTTRSRGRGKALQPERVTANLASVAAKRGRRKAKARHDAEDMPVDGDINEMLALDPASLDPDFEYTWISDGDRARFGSRGYVEEKWGPGCAQPKCYFGAKNRGETIRFRELTLVKLPKERAEAIRQKSGARRDHLARMQAIIGRAKASGGSFTVTQQTVAFPGS